MGLSADSFGLINAFYVTAIILAVSAAATQVFVKETASLKKGGLPQVNRFERLFKLIK